MRALPAILAAAMAAGLCTTRAGASAETATLVPIADAFVDSAHPTMNYGGGGALGVAATGSPRGEFQSLLRLDASAAAAQFDTALGPGLWVLSAASLRLTAVAPNNMLFNSQSPGQLEVSWMEDDSWVEGSGTPGQPGATGITYATLPGYLVLAQESLGVFAFEGGTTETAAYPLTVTPGLAADIGAGGMVSIRVSPVGSTVAYLFNSRTNTSSNQPALVLTAVARCPADFDRSGGLSVLDIFAFLNAWFAGDPRTDFNGVDGIGVPDIFDFLNAWFAGC